MRRWCYYLCLVFCFFDSPAYAEFLCDTNDERLLIRGTDGVMNATVPVINFRFEKAGALGSYLACGHFVDEISRAELGQLDFRLLLPFGRVGRLVGEKKLLQLCLKSSGCRLPWVENFFDSDLVLKSWQKRRALSEFSFCYDTTTAAVNSSFEEIQEQRISELSEVRVIESVDLGEVLLGDYFFKILAAQKWKRVFITTMTASFNLLKRLDEWLISHPELEVFVFFSHPLALMEQEYPDQWGFRSGRLRLMPVTALPGSPNTFHIKGILFEGELQKELLLYSLNFKGFSQNPISDLAFRTRASELIRSFEAVLSKTWRKTCENRHYLSCATSLRFGVHSEKELMIQRWMQASCGLDDRFQIQPGGSFFLHGDDTKTLLKDLIRRVDLAQREILIMTHQLGSTGLTEALKRAQDRGISVKILVGTDNRRDREARGLFKSLGVRVSRTGEKSESHSKFMVLDGAVSFWGTGNLTSTGLSNSHELFFYSKDIQFIQLLTSYFHQKWRVITQDF